MSLMYFHNVVIVFPSKLEHLNFKLNSNSFTKDTIFDIWLKLVKWFWKRRFLNVVNIFLQCRSYLPFERGIIIHLSKLDSPPSMLLTKFGWDGLITSGEVENVKKNNRQTEDERFQLRSAKTGHDQSARLLLAQLAWCFIIEWHIDLIK